MKRIIIAFGGYLPRDIYNKNLYLGHTCIVLVIKEEFNKQIWKDVHIKFFSIKKIEDLFHYLKNSVIKKVYIVGSISKKSILKTSSNIESQEIINQLKKNGLNDKNIFYLIEKELKDIGIKVIPYNNLLIKKKEYKNKYNNLNIEEINDIRKGLYIIKNISRYDIGQALIIKNNKILGIEGEEGTNQLIKRCARYRIQNEGGILIKTKKINQNEKIDLPCIGPDTIIKLAKYNFSGVVYDYKKTVIIKKNKTISLAEKLAIFMEEV